MTSSASGRSRSRQAANAEAAKKKAERVKRSQKLAEKRVTTDRVRDSEPAPTAYGRGVRDETGRTYVATTVDLPSLKLTALRAAIAMAVVSGATGVEAAVIVTEETEFRPEDLAAVADLKGSGAAPRLFLASPAL